MTEILALQYHQYGQADKVLNLETLALKDAHEGQVLIALRRAVVHPSDLGMIAGSYGRSKELPAIGGREGIGEIVTVSDGICSDLLGQHVRMPEVSGVWRQATWAPAQELVSVPQTLPIEKAAQAFINPPTAYRLIKDFVKLKRNDWILQNAGNSAVGFCVAGYAKHLGLRCLSIVRDLKRWEQPLIQAGSTAVIEEGEAMPNAVKAATAGASIQLALNSIGGASVMGLIKAIDEGATVVTFGGMVGEKVRFPTRELIFKNITLRGFWLDQWYRQHSTAEARQMMLDVFQLLNEGTMDLPIDRQFPFHEGLEAVKRASQAGRQGKVLITSDWHPAS